MQKKKRKINTKSNPRETMMATKAKDAVHLNAALSSDQTESLFQEQPEPPAGPNTTRIQLRLVNGKRIRRRFLKTDHVQVIYDFVYQQLKKRETFFILTTYPKKKLVDKKISLIDAQLLNSSLIVELEN